MPSNLPTETCSNTVECPNGGRDRCVYRAGHSGGCVCAHT